MKYEVTVSNNRFTWSKHRTEICALKSYRDAVDNGQQGIQIFRSGTEVFSLNTYDKEIGYDGFIICDHPMDIEKRHE